MNRITQCLHGKGTVSEMIKHHGQSDVHQKYLAYEQVIRPVIFWNVTRRCNLSCHHCYNSSGPLNAVDNELTTDEARNFIHDCAGLRVPVLLLSGGEPLIREDIFELAEYASEMGIKTALSSNGTLITRDMAKKIHDSGIGYVGISLDGATAGTHDAFRNVPGAFERATRAFQHCHEAGVKCGIRITLTTGNKHELSDLIDLALRLGAIRFCLYWLVPSGRGGEMYQKLQVSDKDITDALAILHRYAQVTDPSVMEFLTVDAPQDAVHLLKVMERERSPDLTEAKDLISSMKGGCSAGIRVANVSPEGDVYPCQFAQTSEFFIGSIRTKPFSCLWNDPANQVLSLFRNKLTNLSGQCKTCNHLQICGGGCRVRAYFKAGNINEDDPFCSFRNELAGRND